MQFLQLNNYWWMIIWLFGVGFIFSQIDINQKEIVLGRKAIRWRWIPAIVLALPFIIWAGNRSASLGADTGSYMAMYHSMPSSIFQMGEYLAGITKDKGFTILSIVMKSFLGNSTRMYFMVIACFQLMCIVAVFRKYSSNYWISFFLFIVSTDYISWMLNGMRQFIAVTMIFACLGCILKKRYGMVILVILIAATIHGSALLMLPIIFIIQGEAWNKKTVLVIFAAVIIIAYIDQFTPILDSLLADTQYSDMITNEIWTTDDGTNIIRVLVYSVPAILSFIGRRYVKEANNPVINICVNCSIITMALYLVAAVSSGIYIGRLPIYTTLMGYVSLPWLIDNMFTKESASLVKRMMIVAYLAFFCIQVFYAWA